MVEFEEPTDSIDTTNTIVKKETKLVNYTEDKNTKTGNNTHNYKNNKNHIRTNEENCKGETTALTSHVFRLHTERLKRVNFKVRSLP